jgi:hypothetical protein
LTALAADDGVPGDGNDADDKAVWPFGHDGSPRE